MGEGGGGGGGNNMLRRPPMSCIGTLERFVLYIANFRGDQGPSPPPFDPPLVVIFVHIPTYIGFKHAGLGTHSCLRCLSKIVLVVNL